MTIEEIVERAENWDDYVNRHGFENNWWSKQEACEIIRALLTWAEEGT